MDNETVWSWSRLNSLRGGIDTGEGCAYGWYLTYKEGDRGKSNFFAEYGSLVHNLIEKYHKGEMFDWDIPEELERGLNSFEFQVPFPKMKNSYYNSINDFFCIEANPFEDITFSDRFKDYDVLENELEVIFDLEGNKIKGYIDMVADHKDYGFAVVDFKSSKPYKGDKLQNNIMQLYLYCIGVKEKYGKYPDHLIYYYFRESGQKEYAYKFDINELERTKKFVLETIEMSKNLHNEEDFPPRCLSVGEYDFYACHLCNHRLTCKYKTK